MLKLRPYKPCDAQEITKWLKNEYSFRQWCADRYERFPITAADMNAYYDLKCDSPASWAMTAFDETGLIGHLTMRFLGKSTDDIRFGFIIVNDKYRGKGYGHEMLSLAIKYAFEFIGAKRISLAVFENNGAAKKCYLSCGFRNSIPPKTETYNCMGEEWNCTEMEILG